jgi:hypothetical protein
MNPNTPITPINPITKIQNTDFRTFKIHNQYQNKSVITQKIVVTQVKPGVFFFPSVACKKKDMSLR